MRSALRISPSAAAALRQVSGQAAPVSLAEVNAQAALQTRRDYTYLISADTLRRLSATLAGRFHVLDIDGSRLMPYESVYFDSPDFHLFRAHRQQRRRRFKVRTRRYAATGASFTEVKLKDPMGRTVKFRTSRPAHAPLHQLSTDDTAFIAETVRSNYHQEIPALVPVLESRYHRSTLVDLSGHERMTCDVGLSWQSGDRIAYGSDAVLLETKSSGGGTVDELLLDWGIRPLSMSKYTIGIALLNPGFAAPKWARLLRREYGWTRAA